MGTTQNPPHINNLFNTHNNKNKNDIIITLNNNNNINNNYIPPKILSPIIYANNNNNNNNKNNLQDPSQFPPNMTTGNNTQLEVMQIMDINNVIELNDDDNDHDHDDDECVFVKKERNFKSYGRNKTDPICVDKYINVESYDFGFKTPKNKDDKGKIVLMDVDVYVDGVHCVDLYGGDDDDECCEVKKMMTSSRKRNKPFRNPSVTEKGESSKARMRGKMLDFDDDDDDDVVVEVDPASIVFSSERRRVRKSVSASVDDVVEVDPSTIMFSCEICADTKTMVEAFRIKGCSHSYCSECMRSYVRSKLEEGVSTIGCPVPQCKGVLEPEYCREILPFEVFDRWGTLLCESVILASQKFYCPFKDCSALMIDDGTESLIQCECPVCFRMFCAKCKVAWHQGIACAEYQKLGQDERAKEDIMLRNLAKNQKWQRCPSCKFFVEKTVGCLYMKCRCGVAFCYNCGKINNDHSGHNCKSCGR